MPETPTENSHSSIVKKSRRWNWFVAAIVFCTISLIIAICLPLYQSVQFLRFVDEQGGSFQIEYNHPAWLSGWIDEGRRDGTLLKRQGHHALRCETVRLVQTHAGTPHQSRGVLRHGVDVCRARPGRRRSGLGLLSRRRPRPIMYIRESRLYIPLEPRGNRK